MTGDSRNGASRLRLLAEDAEDLAVMSAALQDAVGRIGDIQFDAAGRRLTVALNRFRWEDVGRSKGGARVRCALQLAGVLSVRAKRLLPEAPDAVVELLAVTYQPTDVPAGVISLTFAGGGELACDVECLDAVLADVSEPWATPRRPAHDLAEG